MHAGNSPGVNIYGTPAGTLAANSGQRFTTADRAKAGRRGELACAEMLEKVFSADPGVHVFHDVTIPSYQANVDHVLVRGDRVVLLDAKQWKSGFYWTIAGRSFRGTERIEWADKHTLPAAVRLFSELFAERGVDATVVPALVLFPSGQQPLRTFAYRAAEGAAVRDGTRNAARWLRRQLNTNAEDQPALLRAVYEHTKQRAVVRLHVRHEPLPSPA